MNFGAKFYLHKSIDSLRFFVQNRDHFHLYKLFFKKEGLIYLNLNKFKIQKNSQYFFGKFWVPEEKVEVFPF